MAVRNPGAVPFELAQLPVVASFADQAALALQLAARQRTARELDVLADRDRIARELHDHVIQRLFAVGLAMQSTHRRADSPELRRRIGDSIDQMHEIVHEIRTAIFDLHGGAAGQQGVRLRHRLYDSITELTDDTAIHPTVSLSGPLDSIPLAFAEHAEAVVRESVGNVVRHARASGVSVSVAVKDDVLRIVVTDDGTGIGGEAVEPGGLRNLRDRAERAGERSRRRRGKRAEPGSSGPPPCADRGQFVDCVVRIPSTSTERATSEATVSSSSAVRSESARVTARYEPIWEAEPFLSPASAIPTPTNSPPSSSRSNASARTRYGSCCRETSIVHLSVIVGSVPVIEAPITAVRGTGSLVLAP